MLTSNDGQTYSDWMDYYSQQREALNDTSKEGGNVTYGIEHGATGHVTPLGSDIKEPLQIQRNMWEHLNLPTRIQGKSGQLNIDNEHHVPLIASGILDEGGNMTGLAIDHRVDVPKEYLPHLALHEATEIPLMHDYMADGMPAQDAYHKAHDIATAVESASVRGYAARSGLDVDKFHDGYKGFFRDAAGVASGPTSVPRHERSHTTVHGLDAAELGGQYQVAGLMDWLFGSSDTAEAKGHPSNYPMSMPTNQEAQEARKGELSYGSPSAAFEEGERGRFIKPGVMEPIYNAAVEAHNRGEEGFTKDTFSFLNKVPTIDINPEYKQKVADIYTKAKLVANRSPITALGFDPRHASVENKELVGTVGLFTKEQDQAWASLGDEDVLAHELTHRGINELKKSGKLTPEETKWLEADNNWYDERLVRYLMDRYAYQDPKTSLNPEAADKMLKEARAVFEDMPRNMHMLQEIESKAQDLYHEKYGQMHHAEDDQKSYKVAEDTGTHAPITKSDIHDPFSTPPTVGEHKPLQIDPTVSEIPQGAYAPMMKLPSGQEISLARSLREVSPGRREEVLNRIFQRQFPGTRSIGAQRKEYEESLKKLKGGKE